MSVPDTLKKQIGGDHYKKYMVQPLEFAEKVGLHPIIFCAFKYVCRYKDKNGKEDLNKALHCLSIHKEIGKEKDVMINTEYLYDFLGQFDESQAQAIFAILQSQGRKVHLERAIRLIEALEC